MKRKPAPTKKKPKKPEPAPPAQVVVFAKQARAPYIAAVDKSPLGWDAILGGKSVPFFVRYLGTSAFSGWMWYGGTVSSFAYDSTALLTEAQAKQACAKAVLKANGTLA